MRIDPSINLALILSFLTVLCAVVWRLATMGRDVEDLREYRKLHEERMDQMEKMHRDLATIVTILSTKAELLEWGRREARKRAGEKDDGE